MFKLKKTKISDQCEQLKKEYEELKTLKQEFDLELEKAIETGNLEKAKELRKELEKRMLVLREKLPTKEIKAIWENPGTGEKKEIILNIEKEIEYFKKLYKEKLDIEIDEKEFRAIWDKNRKEIQKEMETYGYDEILLVPEDLPGLETLNSKLIETMAGTDKTYKDVNFKDIINTEKPRTRIILTKSVQNVYETEDPIIKATLNKDIMELTGLTRKEVETKIKDQESLTINFKTEIKGKETLIQAEGLSLEEYIIFQRKYFDKYQKHLDESGWTWLLKSFSGSLVVYSGWGRVARQFLVRAADPGLSVGDLGGRPSCSFSN